MYVILFLWLELMTFITFLVLYGEPMTIKELQSALPNFQEAAMIHQSPPLEVQPLTIWRDTAQEEVCFPGTTPYRGRYKFTICS